MKYSPRAYRPKNLYFWRVASLSIILCLCVVLSSVDSYSLTDSHILKTTIWPASALPTSLSAGNENVVILPMGVTNNIVNSFWQLFYYNKTNNRWQDIIGKSGVGTNGGLTVDPTSTGKLLLAFLPSMLLKFTPTAILTPDNAVPPESRYSPATPILTGALPTPSDMAQISNDTLLALSHYKNGTGLIATQITKSNWHHVYLSPGPSSGCPNGSLAAIDDPGNLLLAGMDCPGISRQSVMYSDSQIKNNILGIRYINFTVPHSISEGINNGISTNDLSTETLLFNSYNNPGDNLSKIHTENNKTFYALSSVLVHKNHHVYPLGFYSFSLQEDQNVKSVKQVGHIELKPKLNKENFLPISSQYTIVSIGQYGQSGYFIVATKKHHNPTLFISINANSGWQLIANLPPATVTIARIDNGETESFSATKRHFLVYRYIANTKKWRLVQDSIVNIQYGSTS